MFPKPFSHNFNKTLQMPSTHTGRPDFTKQFLAEVAAVFKFLHTHSVLTLLEGEKEEAWNGSQTCHS